MRRLHTSIDTRLWLLVLSELVTAMFGVVTAILVLMSLSRENGYIRHYLFPPMAEIQDAFDDVGALESVAEEDSPQVLASARERIGDLRIFLEHYKLVWQVPGSRNPQALQIKHVVERAGRMNLLLDEQTAVESLEAALKGLERSTGLAGDPAQRPPVRRVEVAELFAAVRRLNRVNLLYVQIGHDAHEASFRWTLGLFVGLGIASIVAASLFGLSIRRAIAPRVRLLVDKIKRFREHGVNNTSHDWGDDEIAVLANTIDVSFRSIAERDKERERFLAVAAHELKTPLSTIKGFAQAALAHRGDPKILERSLSVIDRQATRLARLGQDLLWSARAHFGQLPFKPAPVNLAALARQAISDVELAAERQTFNLHAHGDTHLLGDPGLLEHSLWALLTQAAELSSGAPVDVRIDGRPTSVSLCIRARAGDAAPADPTKLLEPFAVLQFEGQNHDLRGTGLGLHLVQQIARLHGAMLDVTRRPPNTDIVFTLELQR